MAEAAKHLTRVEAPSLLANTGPIVIFTAIVGHTRDTVRTPFIHNPGCPMICFSDRGQHQAHQGPWKIHPPVFKDDDPIRAARKHKLLANLVFPHTTYSIWIDACLTLRVSASELIKYLGVNDIAVFKHPHRKCVYEECRACQRFQKDNAVVIQKQEARYRFAGYPPDNGLAETACLIRKHTEVTDRFNQAWWQELCAGSRRDQISFPYVAWKLRTQYSLIPGCRDRSTLFRYWPHISRYPRA